MAKEHIRLTLIDGPTLLIEIGGMRLLTDPTFDTPQVYSIGGMSREKFNKPSIPPDELLPSKSPCLATINMTTTLTVQDERFFPGPEQ